MSKDVMKANRFLSIFLVLCILLCMSSLSAFGRALSSPTASAHTVGVERKVRVGVYQNEPKVFWDEERQAAGLFIELLEKIAEEERWNLVYVPCAWPNCLQALTDGEIDLMPDVAYSAEREAIYDFLRTPVLECWSRVYAAPQSQIVQIPDLNGMRVAVLRGSIQESVFEQLMDGFGYEMDLVATDSFEQAFKLVADGQVDAAIANNLFGDYFYQEYGLSRTAIDFNPVKLYYATAEGQNADLLAAINRHLDEWIPQRGSPYYTTLGRWTESQARHRVPPAVLWVIGGIGVLLLAAIGATALLRQQVKIRTEHLEQINVELQESEKRFQTLARISPVGIFRTDTKGATTYVNPQWCAIAGLSAEKAMGDGWLKAVHSDDRERLRQGWQEATQLQRPSWADYRFIRPDGTIAWVMGQAVPEIDAEGQIAGYVGTITDITERKKAEDELRKLKDDLEIQVAEKAKELKERVAELEKFHDATIDRELRMNELREEIERLKRDKK